MKSKNVIIQEGSIVNESILSSGTKAGLEIARIVGSILTNRNQFYYCDEKFSYVHSDIEKAFLSIMIDNREQKARGERNKRKRKGYKHSK